MTLDRNDWLRRYRARILYHQPGLSREVLDDYVTLDAYEVMKVDFPEDPELAVDIDSDLAYVGDPGAKPGTSQAKSRKDRDRHEGED